MKMGPRSGRSCTAQSRRRSRRRRTRRKRIAQQSRAISGSGRGASGSGARTGGWPVGPAGPGRSTEQRGGGAAVVQRVEEVGRGKEGGEDSADRWARLVSEGRVRRAGRSAGLRSGRGGRGAWRAGPRRFAGRRRGGRAPGRGGERATRGGATWAAWERERNEEEGRMGSSF